MLNAIGWKAPVTPSPGGPAQQAVGRRGWQRHSMCPGIGYWRGCRCVWGRARALVYAVHTRALFNWSCLQLLRGGEQGGVGKNTKQMVRFGSQSWSLTQQDGPGQVISWLLQLQNEGVWGQEIWTQKFLGFLCYDRSPQEKSLRVISIASLSDLTDCHDFARERLQVHDNHLRKPM